MPHPTGLFGRWRERSQPNPNWYANGEPGTREQWQKRCWDYEDKAKRLKREVIEARADLDACYAANAHRKTVRLRWLRITIGPVWLCIGGRKPLAHLPAWRRRLLHLPPIRQRLI